MRRLRSFFTKTAALGILLLILSAYVGARKPQHVVIVPGHCVNVDKFYGTCKPSGNAEGFDCHVHIRVQPFHECNQFNVQDILQVNQ